MTLQMGMTREDRDPADVLTTWALKEYERLQQEAPTLNGTSVALFKKKFTDPNQSVPDVAEDKFVIKVFNKPLENDVENNVVSTTSSTPEINLEVRAD